MLLLTYFLVFLLSVLKSDALWNITSVGLIDCAVMLEAGSWSVQCLMCLILSQAFEASVLLTPLVCLRVTGDGDTFQLENNILCFQQEYFGKTVNSFCLFLHL